MSGVHSWIERKGLYVLSCQYTRCIEDMSLFLSSAIGVLMLSPRLVLNPASSTHFAKSVDTMCWVGEGKYSQSSARSSQV